MTIKKNDINKKEKKKIKKKKKKQIQIIKRTHKKVKKV